MASISLQRVTKAYGAHTVIPEVSIDLKDGEFLVLVGPSGCGKSTLLRMIAGLESISSGTVLIDGKVVNDLPPKDRDIAMVFQSYALYPHKTVRQNIGFALKMRGMPSHEIAERVKSSAEMLSLTPYLDRYPRQLSGGQRQRVAMGRAIVRSPKAFLFDEPLSNLDAKLRVQMRAEIKELQQRLATTMVYVTHDQIEAMTMADRIVVLRAGIVEQIGTPLDLYDNPANTFVATFIGTPSMNLLTGTISDMNAAAFLTADGTELNIGEGKAHLAGKKLLLGVRPESFELGGDISLKVRLIEPTGGESIVFGKIGGQDVVCAFHERLARIPDTVLKVRIKPGQAHLFNAETTLRET